MHAFFCSQKQARIIKPRPVKRWSQVPFSGCIEGAGVVLKRDVGVDNSATRREHRR